MKSVSFGAKKHMFWGINEFTLTKWNDEVILPNRFMCSTMNLLGK